MATTEPTRNKGVLFSTALLFATVLQAHTQGTEAGLFTFAAEFDPNNSYYYSVKWNQLPLTGKWNPADSASVLSIETEAEKARLQLAGEQQVTNEVRLQSVEIKRLDIPLGEIEAHGHALDDFTNQWFVSFRFWLPDRRRWRQVNALPSGDYAIERAAPPPEVRKSEKITKLGTEAAPSNKQKSAVEVSEPDPFQEVRQSDFSPPTIQWKPFASAFPVELATQIERARVFLAKRRGIADTALTFTKVSIEPYVPEGAINANKVQVLSNLDHWFVIFSFETRIDDLNKKFRVYMLLDGRFLSAGESIWE